MFRANIVRGGSRMKRSLSSAPLYHAMHGITSHCICHLIVIWRSGAKTQEFRTLNKHNCVRSACFACIA